MKKWLTLIICFLAGTGAVYLVPYFTHAYTTAALRETESKEVGYFNQKAVTVSDTPHTVYKLYENGELAGIVTHVNQLDRHLRQVYEERYEADFPGTSCRLGDDLYLSEEESYYVYGDADDEIFSYLDENNLYAIVCTEITFTYDEEVTGRLYVSSYEDYEEAMNTYVSYFADTDAVAAYNNSRSTALTSYGTQDIGVSVRETISSKEAAVSAEEIRTSPEDILYYLEYGDQTDLEYYTVAAYDTVAGVGAKNHGLSASQVMNINRDKISSVDQVLEEGEKLCVTYFSSPINVIVYKRALRKETVFFDTVYTENETLLKGEQEVLQDGENGTRNALYSEKWINGVLTSGTLESSVELRAAVSEVVAVGTMSLPGIGTGELRFPVDNPAISCVWGCYYGHTGTDIVNQYDSWGDIYAADTGVVEENSYNSINGNYIVINHNNGTKSYYGHMLVPSDLTVGAFVEKGDLIGHIGMTGAATGPHVHFHMIVNDEITDACQGYLDCDSVPHL